MFLKTYFIDIDEIEKLDYKEVFSTLPLYRQKKIDSLQNENDKKLSFLAGYLLKKELKKLGFAGKDNEVTIDNYGKEHLPKSCNLFFSLSHSNTKVMLVISDCDVGCDIEFIKKRNLNIADRFFTVNEKDLVYFSNDPTLTLIRIWTLKESYLKLKGIGLSQPLSSVEFIIKDDSVSCSDSSVKIIHKVDENYCYSILY